MEEKAKINRMNQDVEGRNSDSGLKQREQGFRGLRDLGKLKFESVEDPFGGSHQLGSHVIPVRQRRTGERFIFSPEREGFKIFALREGQMKLISKHLYHFPITFSTFYDIISEEYIRFFVSKEKILKTAKNDEFFKKHKIDWTTSSTLVFEVRYQVGGPKILSPSYVSELKHHWNGYFYKKVEDTFDSQKPLQKSNLSVVSGKLESDQSHKIFLVDIDKRSQNLIKKILQLDLQSPNNFHYFNKLFNDDHNFQSRLTFNLNFKPPVDTRAGYYIQNSEPGEGPKFQPLIRVTEKMIIVSLVDLRSRKIAVRGFVSIYELFGRVNLSQICSGEKAEVKKIDYSARLDVLILDVSLSLFHRQEDLDENWTSIERHMGAGLADRRQLTSFFKGFRGDLIEERKLRVIVFGMRKGGRRSIEVVNRGCGIDSSFERSKGRFIIAEQTGDELRIEVLSREVDCPLKAKERAGVSTKIQKLVICDNIAKLIFQIPIEDVKAQYPFLYFGIQSLYMLDEEKILISRARTFQVFDLRSGRILSTTDHCKGIPTYTDEIFIADNILATSTNEFGVLNFYKISKNAKNSVKFDLFYSTVLEYSSPEFPYHF